MIFLASSDFFSLLTALKHAFNIIDQYKQLFRHENCVRQAEKAHDQCSCYVKIVRVILKSIGFANQKCGTKNCTRTVKQGYRQRFPIDSRSIRVYAQNLEILLSCSMEFHIQVFVQINLLKSKKKFT